MCCRSLLLLCVMMLTACDDLNPSSHDQRSEITAGTSGPGVGQIAPDFALFDTVSNPVTMSAELTGTPALVLYFTMWCPVCDSHMSHMRSNTMPAFPDVKFFIIDYVSGSINIARAAQLSNGYADLPVLVDDSQHVLNLYEATMGTTVVIDGGGTVQMNEDYKDGTKLYSILDGLQ